MISRTNLPPDACPLIQLAKNAQPVLQAALFELAVPQVLIRLMKEYAEMSIPEAIEVQFHHDFNKSHGVYLTATQQSWLRAFSLSAASSASDSESTSTVDAILATDNRKSGKTFFLTRYLAVESWLLGTAIYVSFESSRFRIDYAGQMKANDVHASDRERWSKAHFKYKNREFIVFGSDIHRQLDHVLCGIPGYMHPGDNWRVLGKDPLSGCFFYADRDLPRAITYSNESTIVLDDWCQTRCCRDLQNWCLRKKMTTAEITRILKTIMVQVFAVLFPGRRVLGLGSADLALFRDSQETFFIDE